MWLKGSLGFLDLLFEQFVDFLDFTKMLLVSLDGNEKSIDLELLVSKSLGGVSNSILLDLDLFLELGFFLAQFSLFSSRDGGSGHEGSNFLDSKFMESLGFLSSRELGLFFSHLL